MGRDLSSTLMRPLAKGGYLLRRVEIVPSARRMAARVPGRAVLRTATVPDLMKGRTALCAGIAKAPPAVTGTRNYIDRRHSDLLAGSRTDRHAGQRTGSGVRIAPQRRSTHV
jgi:hypothetical protein